MDSNKFSGCGNDNKETVDYIHNNHFLDFLSSNSSSSSCNVDYMIIVLNTPTDNFLPLLWFNAKYRCCCDGGANRILNILSNEQLQNNKPDLVIGDLDSLDNITLEKFTEMKISIIKDDDQDTTDLTKALNFLYSNSLFEKFPILIISGAYGGRFDAQISNFYAIHKFYQQLKSNTTTNNTNTNIFPRIILINENNFCEYLLPGSHLYYNNQYFEQINKTHCGLFPLGNPIKNIISKGLKWDLISQELNWDKLISTNNIIIQNEIYIKTSDPVIFSTEFAMK